MSELNQALNPIQEETKSQEVKIGVVANCGSLNLREQPSVDSNVVCQMDIGTEVIIDETAPVEGEVRHASADEFYKVCTAAGIEGFCMKKYIEVLG